MTTTNDNLREALRLAKLGLRIVPNWWLVPVTFACGCGDAACEKSRGKHPWLSQWPTAASTDPKTIRGWWKATKRNSNVGVACGNRRIVFDVDPRRGGTETFAKLEAEYGDLPKLWTVKSGSEDGDGRHYYFSVPDGFEISSSDRWKEQGVEIMGQGKQVVAPPSLHKSGKHYAWLSQDGNRPPLLPDSWMAPLEATTIPSSSKRPAVDLAAEYDKLTSNRTSNKLVSDNYDNSDTSHTRTLNYPSYQRLDVPPGVLATIVQVVEKTFPRVEGCRNHRLVELGQRLLPIRELSKWDSEQFEPIVAMFLEKAEPLIGKRDLAESMKEWNYIWGTWLRESRACKPILKASEYMKTMPDPLIPSHGYKSKNARALVKLCAAMQSTTTEPDGVWYLSQRDAAREVGLDPEKNQRYVGAIFMQMVRDGMLEKIGEHVQGNTRRAQRYKYHPYNPPTVVDSAAA